ncbi:MAG: hypothetical protein C3F13_08310 [Anaerolineales bacterium]|nr:MAG: hypothetical protein C3F13_08310 [Anaerolineales bacterium]
MVGKIYITHCSWKKDDALQGTNKKVTPDRLYTAAFIQRFVSRCKQCHANWAIFSDKYGIVLPSDVIPWYDMSPSAVTENEYQVLLKNFGEKLIGYDEIWFYHLPTRFHRLYKKLVQDARKQGMLINLFSHVAEIR